MFLKQFKIKRLTKKLKSMQQNRIHNQPKDEILAKEINYYHDLATVYHKSIGQKSYPFAAEMEITALRAAAALDDSPAQYQLGDQLLKEAKMREQLQDEGLFASSSNERQMQQLYEEAHAYLLAAEKSGHIQAKRLRGLCYINGWGVASDKEKGFDLVVSSIDQENSWERVPQIFAEIGLNKPEFFAAIMKHQHKS